jgi:hypothetical protein
MFLDAARKNYQIFWNLQQKNLDLLFQAQEAAAETCAKLIQIGIEKNLDVLEEFSQKIQEYEDKQLSPQTQFHQKNSPFAGPTLEFFTAALKNLTSRKKSLLKSLRDHYFPQGFEMTKKITKTCSLSLMSLMSTVSGRAINSESILDYTVGPMNNVEAISLRTHKAPATSALSLQQAEDYAAYRKKNEEMRATFMAVKRKIDSEKETLKSQQESRWKEAQARTTPYSADWYDVQVEKHTAYAEWYPDMATLHKQRVDVLKAEQAAVIKNAEIRECQTAWQEAQDLTPYQSADWYRIEAEKYTKYAEWYPEDKEYYLEQAATAKSNAEHVQQLAERGALEEQWHTRQAAVDRTSAEWYEVEIERYTKYAEWSPENRDYYLGQAERFREEMRLAPERAARTRQENDWRQREDTLAYQSPEWYDLQAEICNTRAEWYPDDSEYYLEQAALSRESAARMRADAVRREEAARRDRERREAEALAAEALRLEEQRLAAERAAVRIRLNPDWEADLEHARTLAPAAAYEVLKDRLFVFDGYHEPLEAMKQEAALAPRTTTEETAVKKAFWNKLHRFVESQTSLNPDAAGDAPKYFNVIKFLTETQAPDLVIGADPIDDAAWAALAEQTKQLAADVGFDDDDLVGAASHWNPRGNNLITQWFRLLMQCQQADSNSGRNFVRNRAAKIIQYLQELKDEGDESDEKIKLILQKDIIDNAQNCPDRALSGLDNAEVNIKLAEAASPEAALAAVIQKLKKSIIEVILDRTQHEIVEEYLYLALMFNKHLALGLPTTEMTYASCGARKTFDEALGKILENVHYQGAVDMLLAEESWMEALKRLSPEYAAAAANAMETRDTNTDASEEQEEREKAPIDEAFEAAKQAAEERKTAALTAIAADVAQVTAIEDACKAEIAAAKTIRDTALAALPDPHDDDEEEPIFDAFVAAKQAAEDRKTTALIPLQATVDEIKRIQGIYDAEINAARATRRTAVNPIEDAAAQRIEEIKAAYQAAIKSAADRLTKEIFDREFVVTGSKYAGITAEHIAKMEDAIRSDNTSPEQLLARAQARLTVLEEPFQAERDRLEAEVRRDTTVINDIATLQRTAQDAGQRLNELANELMDRYDVWDMDIIRTYPEFIAGEREYQAANAAYEAAAGRDTADLRERIRTNNHALAELNAQPAMREIIHLQGVIRRLEDELRPAPRRRYGW